MELIVEKLKLHVTVRWLPSLKPDTQDLPGLAATWPSLPQLTNALKEHTCYLSYQTALDAYREWSKFVQLKPQVRDGDAALLANRQWQSRCNDLAEVFCSRDFVRLSIQIAIASVRSLLLFERGWLVDNAEVSSCSSCSG